MEERDYLAENAAYLKKDLGKNNISQNLFQRFKELITNGQLPAGYMMPNENVVSEASAEVRCARHIRHWRCLVLFAVQRQVPL